MWEWHALRISSQRRRWCCLSSWQCWTWVRYQLFSSTNEASHIWQWSHILNWHTHTTWTTEERTTKERISLSLLLLSVWAGAQTEGIWSTYGLCWWLVGMTVSVESVSVSGQMKTAAGVCWGFGRDVLQNRAWARTWHRLPLQLGSWKFPGHNYNLFGFLKTS